MLKSKVALDESQTETVLKIQVVAFAEMGPSSTTDSDLRRTPVLQNYSHAFEF